MVSATEVTPFPVLDILTGLVKSNTVPSHEYLLQGRVLYSNFNALLQKLRGLSENVDNGAETFHDNEMSFSIKNGSLQPFTLKVRRSLNYIQNPYQLSYIGQPDVGNNSRQTTLRSIINVPITSKVKQFLIEMGFCVDYEHILHGFIFRRGTMKITVTQLFKELVTSKPTPENVDPLSQSHLVELSVLASNNQENISEDMRMFAEQLKPLVNLEKVDCSRL